MLLPFRVAPLFIACAASLVWCGFGTPALAQTLNLTRTPSTITFSAADPDTTPTITAPSVTVTYRVRGNSGNNWRLTLLAGGDLTTGSASIAIANVTWTATPAPPFQAGTLSKTVAQTLASGTGNVDPVQSATVVFRLANSWTYNVGIYTASVVFTLSAP